MGQKDMKRYKEEGNVLFLILIAVALFAALSYAVTQSTRSGSGDASSETNLISSSTLTQYPAGIRTALVRMIIANGRTVDDFEFNSPSDFGDCTGAGGTPATFRNCVFHPAGGGSTYQLAPADVMADGNAGQWYYNGNFEVPNLGTAGDGGNELIAFLPGVSQGICRKLNEEYGLPYDTSTAAGIPDFDGTDANYTESQDTDNPGMPTGDQEDIDNATSDFDGQPFGCFFDTSMPADDQYIYYHVLIER